jgi:tetratricopeptide (TPR) repeat protein
VVALDPTDEQAHRELMREHLAAGRRREAIRQFERLRDALRERVGVGPDRATIALYEQVLAAEGEQPPEPAQRAAVLIATGLVHLNRHDFAEAERLARKALDLAVDAGLAHELGEASTLLALVASFTGRWHEVFLEEFTASLRHRDELTVAAYDANLCFAEYHLAGALSAPDAETYARELLALADESASKPGRGVARLMLGEALLGAGRYDEARDHLTRALRENAEAGATSGWCVSVERLAQVEAATGRPGHAAALLDQARPTADDSPMRSHLLVRLLGVALEAAPDPAAARMALTAAERALADTRVVCEPCSVNYRVHATITAARAGDLTRAGRHLGDAERIAGLWQGGRWPAAIWEARAALRRAENQPARATALLHEAASAYAAAGRPADERRCLAAAADPAR